MWGPSGLGTGWLHACPGSGTLLPRVEPGQVGRGSLPGMICQGLGQRDGAFLATAMISQGMGRGTKPGNSSRGCPWWDFPFPGPPVPGHSGSPAQGGWRPRGKPTLELWLRMEQALSVQPSRKPASPGGWGGFWPPLSAPCALELPWEGCGSCSSPTPALASFGAGPLFPSGSPTLSESQ